MGLNETPSSERVHIGFFGRRNAGKSSVVNAVTGQELSVVSEVKGTTTDPVFKSMELLPMGPVVIIDTPGFDDEGALGEMRVRKTKQILNRADCAVLVVDGAVGKTKTDEELILLFKKKKIPYVVAYNKCDLTGSQNYDDGLSVSASEGLFIHELKERIGSLVNTGDTKMRIVGDLLNPYDLVVLVIPIDKAAPKGRLILPQQQVIRDILEAGAISVAVRETELKETLERLGTRPALVITDSQVFGQVSKDVPEEILLTSFSILLARYKGFLADAVKGVAAIGDLKDGDKILISEGCTHHRQCDDIGTVKLPRWLLQYTGKELLIETSSGREFPEDLSAYKLIIHCGGCMLNEREMDFRRKCASDAGVPFTNYGIGIAYMKGILKRSLKPLPHLEELLH
ncbi:[FeFe] hydrogenase H-cluster maturation GTPase HydF [Lacrimispora sp. BS-2]|uniref:[FeFe] hydrogenase H-cluster maturation GTPase HydF n=1 Tax=Lacrimispora sp. BS-2 TaxID=3151850 RepID=A0AAU7PRZ0_9FIRM